MSNATPLMLGLAGGLALWHFAPSAPPALRNASGGPCVIQLDSSGLSIDGETVEVDEAVRRAQVVGLALVTVAPDAPASIYAALMTGLRVAGVPAHARVAGASKHLSNAAKVAWCKSVVALYQRERALAQPPVTLVA